jgi:hypothetical protein
MPIASGQVWTQVQEGQNRTLDSLSGPGYATKEAWQCFCVFGVHNLLNKGWFRVSWGCLSCVSVGTGVGLLQRIRLDVHICSTIYILPALPVPFLCRDFPWQQQHLLGLLCLAVSLCSLWRCWDQLDWPCCYFRMNPMLKCFKSDIQCIRALLEGFKEGMQSRGWV